MFRGATTSTPGASVFPTLVQRTHSSTLGGTISRSITLPSSITAGQRIVLVLSLQSASITTPPSGYTQVSSLAVYHKSATGSEGSTVVSFNISSSSSASNHSALVFDSVSQVEATVSTASTANANPPSLTVSWGADDNLFLAMYQGVSTLESLSGYPANCSLYHTEDTSGALDVYIAGAESTLATFNPDAFTTGANAHEAITLGLTA